MPKERGEDLIISQTTSGKKAEWQWRWKSGCPIQKYRPTQAVLQRIGKFGDKYGHEKRELMGNLYRPRKLYTTEPLEVTGLWFSISGNQGCYSPWVMRFERQYWLHPDWHKPWYNRVCLRLDSILVDDLRQNSLPEGILYLTALWWWWK